MYLGSSKLKVVKKFRKVEGVYGTSRGRYGSIHVRTVGTGVKMLKYTQGESDLRERDVGVSQLRVEKF